MFSVKAVGDSLLRLILAMRGGAIVSIYRSFGELVKKEGIESLPRNRNQQLSNAGRQAFAYFRYEGRTWRVNADSKVDRVMQAYECLKSGGVPFIMTTTDKGTCCLDLKRRTGPKGLYVYEVP